MRVNVKYHDKEMNIVDETDLEFGGYCAYLSQKLIGLLYEIESAVADKGRLRKIRHRLFDIAGEVKRLPENMYEEKQKASLSVIHNFFRGR